MELRSDRKSNVVMLVAGLPNIASGFKSLLAHAPSKLTVRVAFDLLTRLEPMGTTTTGQPD